MRRSLGNSASFAEWIEYIRYLHYIIRVKFIYFFSKNKKI
ncbi:hypothetical protein EKS21_05640 [Streptococcus mutans]|nr:hypothetical protein [Streptococcus mutans]